MANKTVSDLVEVISAKDSDVILIENENSTNKITKSNLLKEVKEGMHTHSNKTELDKIEIGDKAKWDSKSDFSGNYNDLINKPIIPTVDVDKKYVDDKLAEKSPLTHRHDASEIDNLPNGGSGSADLSGYQLKTDNTLITASKTVVGAINENKSSLDNIKTRVDNIEKNGTGETTSAIEPQWNDVPKIFFTSSDMLTLDSKADGEKIVEFEYISKTKKFRSYATVAIQGTTSATFPKKNYTLKLYKDNEKIEKEYMDIKGWGSQTKFCLKANYVDTTHTRNLAGARIAYDMIESRPNSDFKTSLQTAPRNGLVDGFPIKVFVNGIFHGVYTWNIPKDKWTFNNAKMVLCAERNNDGTFTSDDILRCEFRKEWDGTDGNSWSIEVGDLTDDLKNSFNRCVNFVMTASDTDFKNNISNYFDLYSLLDYYCFSYFCCHLDGLAKNMLMVTYDGIHWGASLYDMDSLFGAWYDGSKFVATDYQCPEQYQETNSLLWQRIENCFSQELYTRYKELRKGALSLGNIVAHVEHIYDLISDRDISEEKAKWVDLPSVNTNTIARFRDYMQVRATYVDTEVYNIANPIEQVPCTSITLSDDTLTFTDSTSQTLTYTIEPSGTTDTVAWSISPTNIALVTNGTITPIANGECIVTVSCGSQTDTCNVSISGIASANITGNLVNGAWNGSIPPVAVSVTGEMRCENLIEVEPSTTYVLEILLNGELYSTLNSNISGGQLNSNKTLKTYTWNTDFSGVINGKTSAFTTQSDSAYFYFRIVTTETTGLTYRLLKQ